YANARHLHSFPTRRSSDLPVPSVPAMFTMPSLSGVVASATISGTGVEDAESNTVESPGKTGAAVAFVQVKLSCTSVGAKGAAGGNGRAQRLTPSPYPNPIP